LQQHRFGVAGGDVFRNVRFPPISDIPKLVQIAGMIGPWLMLALVSAPTQAPPDQSADALLLLNFIDAVKRGQNKEAEALLAPSAFIGDYAQAKRTSFAEFASYARGCKLSKLTLVPSADQRMPIGAQWFCRYPEGDRSASFWFEDNRISRIGWGKPPVIRVAPLKQK
jgi:hypothetical protein